MLLREVRKPGLHLQNTKQKIRDSAYKVWNQFLGFSTGSLHLFTVKVYVCTLCFMKYCSWCSRLAYNFRMDDLELALLPPVINVWEWNPGLLICKHSVNRPISIQTQIVQF